MIAPGTRVRRKVGHHKTFIKSLAGPVKNMNLGVKPWIEARAKDLQNQLQFQVEPGTPDRVKKPVHKPTSGSSDTVDALSASNSDATRPGAVVGLVVSIALVVNGVL